MYISQLFQLTTLWIELLQIEKKKHVKNPKSKIQTAGEGPGDCLDGHLQNAADQLNSGLPSTVAEWSISTRALQVSNSVAMPPGRSAGQG